MKMMILAADNDLGSLFSGLAGIVIFLVVITLALAWLIFPFVLMSALDRLLKETRKTTERLAQIEQWQRRADGHLAAMRMYYEPAAREPGELAEMEQSRGG